MSRWLCAGFTSSTLLHLALCRLHRSRAFGYGLFGKQNHQMNPNEKQTSASKLAICRIFYGLKAVASRHGRKSPVLQLATLQFQVVSIFSICVCGLCPTKGAEEVGLSRTPTETPLKDRKELCRTGASLRLQEGPSWCAPKRTGNILQSIDIP